MLKPKIEYVFITPKDLPRHPFKETLKMLEATLRERSMPVRTEALPGKYGPEYVRMGRGQRLGVTRSNPPVGIWVPNWAAAVSIICLWRAYSSGASDSTWQRALNTLDSALAFPPDADQLIGLLALYRLGEQMKAWRRLRFLVRKVREKAGLEYI